MSKKESNQPASTRKTASEGKQKPKSSGTFSRTSMTSILINVGIIILLCCLFLIYVKPAATALICGLALYFILSTIAKMYFLRYQRAGMKLVRMKQFAAAQLEFEKSFSYFSEYPWIDRYRAFFMLDTSEISYTEMSLNNIAYCSCKLKNFSAARDSYEKLAKLYPKSELAKIGFQNLENSEQYQSELAVAETSSEQDIPVSAENTSNNCAPSFSKYDN